MNQIFLNIILHFIFQAPVLFKMIGVSSLNKYLMNMGGFADSYFFIRKRAHAIYRDFFFSCKNCKFHQKIIDILYICAQNIDCGYTLERVRFERVPTICVMEQK